MPNFSRPFSRTDSDAASAITESQQRMFDAVMELAEVMNDVIRQQDATLDKLGFAGLGARYTKLKRELEELEASPSKKRKRAEEVRESIKTTETEVLLAMGEPEGSDFDAVLDATVRVEVDYNKLFEARVSEVKELVEIYKV